MAKDPYGNVPPKLVGERLDAIERSHGKTEMANLIGVGPTAWSRLKEGKNRFAYHYALALKDEFGVSIEWIYGGARSHNQAGFNERLEKWENRDKAADPPKRGRPPKSDKIAATG
jgi:transcriptional regulator with XRE-family HTH domain